MTAQTIDPRQGIAATTFDDPIEAFFADGAQVLRGQGDSRGAECFDKASKLRMRHSRASHAIASGMPIEIAQQNLGHASLATTTVHVTTEMRWRMRYRSKIALGFGAVLYSHRSLCRMCSKRIETWNLSRITCAGRHGRMVGVPTSAPASVMIAIGVSSATPWRSRKPCGCVSELIVSSMTLAGQPLVPSGLIKRPVTMPSASQARVAQSSAALPPAAEAVLTTVPQAISISDKPSGQPFSVARLVRS